MKAGNRLRLLLSEVLSASVPIIDLQRIIAEYSRSDIILCVGGWYENMATVVRFDDQLDRFRPISVGYLSYERWNAALVLDDDGRILVIGGCQAGRSTAPKKIYELVATDDGRIDRCGVLSADRHAGLQAIVRTAADRPVIVGSNYRDGRPNSCLVGTGLDRLRQYFFDGRTERQIRLPSSIRLHTRGSTMVVVGNRLWSAVGSKRLACFHIDNDGSDWQFTSFRDVGIDIDPSTESYMYLSDVGGRLLLSTGQTVFAFDVAADSWSVLIPSIGFGMPTAGQIQYFSGPVIFDGCIGFFGSTADGHAARRFDLRTGQPLPIVNDNCYLANSWFNSFLRL